MRIGIEIAMTRINDEYGNASKHRKCALLDYVLALPETEVAILCKCACVVSHRAQCSDFHRSLSMLAMLQCSCASPKMSKMPNTGHIVRTCRQEATATLAAIDLDTDLD